MSKGATWENRLQVAGQVLWFWPYHTCLPITMDGMNRWGYTLTTTTIHIQSYRNAYGNHPHDPRIPA